MFKRFVIPMLLVLLFLPAVANAAEDLSQNNPDQLLAKWKAKHTRPPENPARVAAWKTATTESIQKPQAEWGDAEFQEDLAGEYEKGEFGMKQDYVEAYFWYSLVHRADFWNILSVERWKLAGHLTHEQKVAVDKRVAEWKPTYGPLLFGPEKSDGVEYFLTTPPKDGMIPDQATAIQVAEAFLKPLYGDMKKEEPFTAGLENGVVWVVRGSMPPSKPDMGPVVGGVAVIAIAKSDGRVLGYYHGE